MHQLTFAEWFPDEIQELMVGDRLNLWTHGETEFINVYRPRSIGGQGLVGRISKDANRWLNVALSAGTKIWLEVAAMPAGRLELVARMETEEDKQAATAALRARRVKELARPTRVIRPFTLPIRTKAPYGFNVGQRFTLQLEPLEHYLTAWQFQSRLQSVHDGHGAYVAGDTEGKLRLTRVWMHGAATIEVQSLDPRLHTAGDGEHWWDEVGAVVLVSHLP